MLPLLIGQSLMGTSMLPLLISSEVSARFIREATMVYIVEVTLNIS